jgi:hypothetical protein
MVDLSGDSPPLLHPWELGVMELPLVAPASMDLLPVPGALFFNRHYDKKKHTQTKFGALRYHLQIYEKIVCSTIIHRWQEIYYPATATITTIYRTNSEILTPVFWSRLTSPTPNI